MLQPYVRPQDTITQILQQTAARAASRRNPLVIGPQFELFLNDGRNLDGAKLEFAAAGANSLSYTDGLGRDIDLNDLTPVTAEAELHGENLDALVASFTSGLFTLDTGSTNFRRLRVATNLLAGAGTLNSALDGRQVRVGDVLKVTSLTNAVSSSYWRKVVGLLGEITAATPAASLTKSAAPTNAVTNASDSYLLLVSGTTAGITASAFSDANDNSVFREHGRVFTDGAGLRKVGDELTIQVTTGGAPGVAVVSVTSAALGVTSAGITTGGSESTFEIDLDGLGYPVGTTVSIDHTGALDTSDKAKVRVFPTFTVPDLSASLTIGGSFAGSRNLQYVIEVIAVVGDNADVKIYDTLGVDGASTSAALDHDNELAALGVSGLQFTLADAAGRYYVGQKFYVDAVAASVSAIDFDGVVLDGPVVDAAEYDVAGSTTITEVLVHQSYTGPLDSSNLAGGIGDAVTAGASDWSYAANLGLDETVTGKTVLGISEFADGRGKVVLSYKAIVKPSDTESVIMLDSVSAITDKVGETGQDNWLGRGALEAFRGNQNQVVYALRTAGDTVADFTAALNKIKTTDQVYALAVMSDDLAVMQLVKDHCDAMSNKYNKNFRRCYVGTDSPGAYEYWGQLPGGGYRTADLVSGVVTLSESFRGDWEFTADDIGSSITVLALGMSFTITDVLNSYEVETDAAIALFTSSASGIIVTRPDTAAATALYVADRSKALNSRRCVNVWSDKPTIVGASGLTEVVAAKFLAAEIAGLRCALLPQQGLTMTEITSASAAPGMYTKFTPEQLDYVAANGTFVVTQESEGGDVFIRHQLTTNISAGALAYEDNVGVIVDEFSYAVKDSFRSYIGRRNATPDTIAEIDDRLRLLATDFTQVELINQQIGPAVLAFFDENGQEGQVTVRQDGDLADTLLTYVKLRVPLPLNGINHYIDVEVSELLAGEDN